jgi:hypothetical protein
VLHTSGVVVVGRSEARSIACCRTTLLFLSTLKLARNLAFASWISCSLCSSNWSCSSADKVSQVGSMILLGRLQSYPLNRPLRADLTGLYVLSPAESPKSELELIRAPITALRTGGGALCTGADGPRPGAGWSTTWSRATVPCLTGQTVCACAGAAEFADDA